MKKGSHHTEVTKQKCGIKPKDFSERMKESYRNNPDLCRQRAKQTPWVMLSKKRQEEVKEKIRNTVNNNYKTKPEIKENLRQKRLLQILPIEGTKIEILLENELTKRQLRFERQKTIEICQPDIFLPEYKIIIFADGCYWHGCPIHFPKHNPNSQHDKGCTEYLKKCGYIIFRFWEHEINESPEKCIDKILQYIKIGRI